MGSVHFESGKKDFKLKKPRKTREWINKVAKSEGRRLGSLNYVFCSDDFLLSLNVRYLNHDTFTDIITFDYSSQEELEGEIYISVDRVEENAPKYATTFEDELHRVIIHGLLHLMGYRDNTQGEKVIMRKKEEAYLSLRQVSRGTGH